jgi:hypothetical protein
MLTTQGATDLHVQSPQNNYSADNIGFPKFPELPVEIRLRIWESALEAVSPRQIEISEFIVKDRAHKGHHARFWNRHHGDHYSVKLRIRGAPVPVLLQVSREVRSEATKATGPYSLEFNEITSGRPVYVDYAKDEIIFRNNSTLWRVYNVPGLPTKLRYPLNANADTTPGLVLAFNYFGQLFNDAHIAEAHKQEPSLSKLEKKATKIIVHGELVAETVMILKTFSNLETVQFKGLQRCFCGGRYQYCPSRVPTNLFEKNYLENELLAAWKGAPSHIAGSEVGHSTGDLDNIGAETGSEDSSAMNDQYGRGSRKRHGKNTKLIFAPGDSFACEGYMGT